MTGSEAGSLLSAMGRHLEEVLGRASQGGDASEDASSEALRDAVYLLLNELEGVNRPKALQAIQSHGFSCARDKESAAAREDARPGSSRKPCHGLQK